MNLLHGLQALYLMQLRGPYRETPLVREQNMYWESSDTKRDRLLTRSEVALIFRVSPSTVARWGKEGRLPSVLAPGGQRRYPKLAVERLARELSFPVIEEEEKER